MCDSLLRGQENWGLRADCQDIAVLYNVWKILATPTLGLKLPTHYFSDYTKILTLMPIPTIGIYYMMAIVWAVWLVR